MLWRSVEKELSPVKVKGPEVNGVVLLPILNCLSAGEEGFVSFVAREPGDFSGYFGNLRAIQLRIQGKAQYCAGAGLGDRKIASFVPRIGISRHKVNRRGIVNRSLNVRRPEPALQLVAILG